MDVTDIRFRIAAARRILYRQGCDSNIGGHVSARAHGEDAFWVTGLCYSSPSLPEPIRSSAPAPEQYAPRWIPRRHSATYG